MAAQGALGSVGLGQAAPNLATAMCPSGLQPLVGALLLRWQRGVPGTGAAAAAVQSGLSPGAVRETSSLAAGSLWQDHPLGCSLLDSLAATLVAAGDVELGVGLVAPAVTSHTVQLPERKIPAWPGNTLTVAVDPPGVSNSETRGHAVGSAASSASGGVVTTPSGHAFLGGGTPRTPLMKLPQDPLYVGMPCVPCGPSVLADVQDPTGGAGELAAETETRLQAHTLTSLQASLFRCDPTVADTLVVANITGCAAAAKIGGAAAHPIVSFRVQGWTQHQPHVAASELPSPAVAVAPPPYAPPLPATAAITLPPARTQATTEDVILPRHRPRIAAAGATKPLDIPHVRKAPGRTAGSVVASLGSMGLPRRVSQPQGSFEEPGGTGSWASSLFPETTPRLGPQPDKTLAPQAPQHMPHLTPRLLPQGTVSAVPTRKQGVPIAFLVPERTPAPAMGTEWGDGLCQAELPPKLVRSGDVVGNLLVAWGIPPPALPAQGTA